MRDMKFENTFRNAVHLYHKGHYELSIHELMKLSAHFNSLKGCWEILARNYQKIGKIQDAIDACRKALQFDIKNPNLYSLLANLLVLTGDLNGAENNYRKTVELEPNNYIFHYNLGLFLFNRKLYSEAICCLLISLELNPGHDKSKYILVRSRFSVGGDGNYIKAKEMLAQQLSINISDRYLHSLWAEQLWLAGDSEWNYFYNLALREYKINQETIFDYVVKLVHAGDNDYAKSIIYKSRELISKDSMYFLQAFVNYNSGSARLALDDLRKISNVSHSSSMFQRLAVYVHLALNDVGSVYDMASRLIANKALTQEDIALYAISLKKVDLWSEYRYIYDYDRMVKSYMVPVPSGFSSIKCFNKDLLDFLCDLHKSSNHPLEQSLRNGTQTLGMLFENGNFLIQSLKNSISYCVMDFIKSMPEDPVNYFFKRKLDSFKYTGSWSVNLSNNGFHRNHFHNEGWISGCYYIDVPDAVNDNGQGWIKFGQAELVSDFSNDPDLFISPRPGSVVLFPSYMWHGTVPFETGNRRLTIAFDLVPT